MLEFGVQSVSALVWNTSVHMNVGFTVRDADSDHVARLSNFSASLVQM